jgi:hypothetical protein
MFEQKFCRSTNFLSGFDFLEFHNRPRLLLVVFSGRFFDELFGPWRVSGIKATVLAFWSGGVR